MFDGGLGAVVSCLCLWGGAGAHFGFAFCEFMLDWLPVLFGKTEPMGVRRLPEL